MNYETIHRDQSARTNQWLKHREMRMMEEEWDDDSSDLQVSQPGDASEIEARQKASAVNGGGSGSMPSNKGDGMTASKTIESSLQNKKSTGEVLPDDFREEVESVTGEDHSDVRLHTDANAARMASTLNANAFAFGKDIYMPSENYDLASDKGRNLLAEEVVHTGQANGGKKVHRSIKFEIQCWRNRIWVKDRKGEFKYLPRKYGAYGKTESGDTPAYIATGKHGREARLQGTPYYKEVKGERVTERTDLPESKFTDYTKYMPAGSTPQFEVDVLVNNMSILDSGLVPDPKDLTVINTSNNADDTQLAPLMNNYEKGVYKFRYFDASTYHKPTIIGPILPNTPLEYHRNEEGVFVKNTVDEPGTFMQDVQLSAQYIYKYQFKENVSESDLINNQVGDNGIGKLELRDTENKADILPPDRYHPNTFEFQYFKNDGVTLLDVHLNRREVFKNGHEKYMKVGRRRPMLNDNIDAEHTKIFKVSQNDQGDYSYHDPVQDLEMMMDIEEVEELAFQNTGTAKKDYNPDTYELKYYMSDQFNGNQLIDNAVQMDAHLDANEARLVPEHVKFMNEFESEGNIIKPWSGSDITKDVGEEQTGIELQAEEHGFVEFETPKWFRKWDDMKLRLDDAVEMVEKLNSAVAVNISTDERDQMQEVKDGDMNPEAVGSLRKWPEDMITPGLADRLDKRNEELFIEIVDTDWPSFFQTSEEIQLSEFDNLFKDYEENDTFKGKDWHWSYIRTKSLELSQNLISEGIASSTHSGDDMSLYQNLTGFLQLVISYFFWAQINGLPAGNKNIFPLMARNNFGEMYKQLLSTEEQDVFDRIVSDPETVIQNTTLKDSLEKVINHILINDIVLDSTTQVYIADEKDEKINPTVYDWLSKITEGVDLLADAPQGEVSAAIGGQELKRETDTSGYGMARFEKRSGLSYKSGKSVNKDTWVEYGKLMFELAMQRSNDTPNDPRTPNVNESSKTSIKLD